MPTNRFLDRFNRVDGAVGSEWEIVCGNLSIFDEAVRPIDSTGSASPTNPSSPLAGLTDERTQAFYAGDTLDLPDMVVRGVWGHDAVTPSDVSDDPSFSLLVRSTKDPLLLDLGGSEEPSCYDQGYGLRVTCPLSGETPTLKIIKKTPDRRINVGSNNTGERDDATVLASVQLRRQDLNTDPSTPLTEDNKHDVTGVAYKGFWQDMRLRIRGTDGRVHLEAYINDRYENQPILSYTDHQEPLWSVIGKPGIEFLSPALNSQPSGASPFEQLAQSVMACTLFEVHTVVHFDTPRTAHPSTRFTYGRVVDAVLLVVEKNGDSQYTATAAGRTKRDTYLDFVMYAESEIIRTEGYFDWLKTEARVYLQDDVDVLEMPEDFGELLQLRPGNWNGAPLTFVEPVVFRQYVQNLSASKGKPRSFTKGPVSPNHRDTYKVHPIPKITSINTQGLEESEDAFLVVEYFRRRLRPYDMDTALPVVPQGDIDVLIYGAAAHALLLDTDPENARSVIMAYQGKLQQLRRRNNRNAQQVVMRAAADVILPSSQTRLPMLRSTQLEALL